MGLSPTPSLVSGGTNINTFTKVARWIVAALGIALLVFLLVNREYRESFVSGSGIAQGALIAAIALGVILTYRGSGVVNFANGAIAMYIAYVYAVLRRDGDLFLPPLPNPLRVGFHGPNIPTRISFGDGMSFWPALLISLGVCVILGLILHLLVFRPLRHAPPLAKVVASVGVFLYLQAVVIRRFAITPQTVRPLPFVKKKVIKLHLHTGPVNVKFSITQEQLFVAILVIVIAFLLWLLFQKTRFGLATRAAAENEKGAVVLGFSPDFLAGTNWVLSTLITGLLGIFVASTQSTIEPVVLPALIVPAVVAALVGSFTSFGRTTAAAFVLGMTGPLILYLGPNKGWFPTIGSSHLPFPGVDRLVPILIVVIVLYVAGDALPTRGAISSGRLPFAPTPTRRSLLVWGPLLAVVGAIAGLFFMGPDYRGALSDTLIGIIICLSVVVITGFVGQISLAQMAFAGISAFFVSRLSSTGATVNILPWKIAGAFGNWRVDIPKLGFPWPIFLGATLAMLVGIVVALPALRVRGVNLAIVTFAFAVAVDAMIFGNQSVTGGYNGAPVKAPGWVNPDHPSSHFLGIKIGNGTLPNPSTAIFCLIAAVVLCYIVANIRRSTTGRQMLAMRSNERAAAAAGVNVSGTKVLAFAVSAFIAGVGGAVIAYRSGNVTADKFDYSRSLLFFAFAYLGGISSVGGAVAGGFLVGGGLVFTFLDSTLGISTDFTLMLGGLALIVSAILNPEGVAGRLRSDGKKIASKFKGSGKSAEPSETPPTPVGVPAGEAS